MTKENNVLTYGTLEVDEFSLSGKVPDTLIIHDADPDGCFGNYLYRLAYGLNFGPAPVAPVSEAVGHGESFKNYDFSAIKQAHVVIIDHDVSQDILDRLDLNENIRLIEIYDHHPMTAKLDVLKMSTPTRVTIPGVVNHSSAYLVRHHWVYERRDPLGLNPMALSSSLEYMVTLINAYDTWTFADQEEEDRARAFVSRLFKVGLEKYKSVEFWNQLAMEFDAFCEKAMAEYSETKARCQAVVDRYMVKGMFDCNHHLFDGKRFSAAIIAHSDNMDLVADAALKSHPDLDFVAIFYMKSHSGAKNFKVSLRSRDGVDVSKIAAFYGNGGGHKNASGMQINLSDFITFLYRFDAYRPVDWGSSAPIPSLILGERKT